MFNVSEKETTKRLDIAKTIRDVFAKQAKSILLAGSVAYAPNYSVNKNSDIDLLIVMDNLKDAINFLETDKFVKEQLQYRVLDGYSTKQVINDVEVSKHFLSSNALEIICKSTIANILLYRPDGKDGIYDLKGFEGNDYPYKIKHKDLDGLGIRITVPISFIKGGRYFNGVHRDKLLSNVKILYDSGSFAKENINSLWKNVSMFLYNESMRLYGKIDLNKMNILNSLVKKDRMSPEVKEFIINKTKNYIIAK